MTEQEIIDLIKSNVELDDYGNHIYYHTIADELLSLFKKELSERLEKLHTEMDERMREEVAIEKRMGEKKAENAKKEVAREIFIKIYNELEYDSLGQFTIIKLAKEYRVEL